MTEFDYVVKLEKFLKMKTKKDAKAEAMQLVKDLKEEDGTSGWGNNIYIRDNFPQEKLTQYYHLFSVCKTVHKDRLQDYIESVHRNLESNFTNRCTTGNAVTYQEVVEFLKHTSRIEFTAYRSSLKHLINVIDNNPLPCEFNITFFLSSDYSHLLSNRQTAYSYLLELEKIKRDYGREDLTILNQLLDEHYTTVNKYTDGSREIETLTKLDETIAEHRIGIETIKQKVKAL